MKKTILACACALLLSTGSTFAQMQPAPGGAAHGDVGPGATKSMTKNTHMKKGTTTGMSSGKMKTRGSSSRAPSSSGNVGPGTNNNAGPQPGGK
ncbi:hypothetical protein [Bradyrhizobium australiense]|uniref:Pentapeptide MXKDX repeat protein n=1 Tax=Bradyrhizobium australiense TaxID=2721161 RepID=A0A7Y4LUH0_9BRAD|nr:hypothetical protein [Bradyrhizobium australiense]NOJ39302.1 hypothetical protein [Bradyrhizobium australiense]